MVRKANGKCYDRKRRIRKSTGGEYYLLCRKLAGRFSRVPRAQAERTHLFKMAVAAIVAGNIEAASGRVAEYTAAAEAHGTTFEKRRVHELAGYLAAMNDDAPGAASHLAQANQLEPIVLYWSAVANKDAGNTEKAIELEIFCSSQAFIERGLSPLADASTRTGWHRHR